MTTEFIPDRVTVRAKGLIREAVADIMKSHNCEASVAANLLGMYAMAEFRIIDVPENQAVLAEIEDWRAEMEQF